MTGVFGQWCQTVQHLLAQNNKLPSAGAHLLADLYFVRAYRICGGYAGDPRFFPQSSPMAAEQFSTEQPAFALLSQVEFNLPEVCYEQSFIDHCVFVLQQIRDHTASALSPQNHLQAVFVSFLAHGNTFPADIRADVLELFVCICLRERTNIFPLLPAVRAHFGALISQTLSNRPPNTNTTHTHWVGYLEQTIRFHQDAYYKLATPYLSDAAFDFVFQLLDTQQIPSNGQSPTQVVGDDTRGSTTHKHLRPMLSLQNLYKYEELERWLDKIKEKFDRGMTVICEPKLDGVSISLTYRNGQLTRALTRGNGLHGDDITENARYVCGVVDTLDHAGGQVDLLEVRGEVVIEKVDFATLQDLAVKNAMPVPSNARNYASGSLRLKESALLAERKLSLYTYHISVYEGEQTLLTHQEHCSFLEKTGLRSISSYQKTAQTAEQLRQVLDYYAHKRAELPFETDGVVVKVNTLSTQNLLGSTAHHPRWAFAWKFQTQRAHSKLLHVDFQVGRTGTITPVAKIQPTFLGGTTISSISLFNENIICAKDIRLGDTVILERAGEVIPYIAGSVPALRDGTERRVEFPTHCPSCHNPLTKREDESILRCVHPQCEEQLIQKLIQFTSKHAMDIRHLGEENIRRFFQIGYLRAIPDIYTLPYDKIATLDGFGKKSTDNLRSAIEASKQNAPQHLLFGLGIRFVGRTLAGKIVSHIQDLRELFDWDTDRWKSIQDIGDKTAQQACLFFHQPSNRALIERLHQLGVNIANHPRAKGDALPLHGLSFLFTGTLSSCTRDQAHRAIQRYGGVIASNVSTKLQYLVCGENSGSKLQKARAIPSISILDEQEFMRFLREHNVSL